MLYVKENEHKDMYFVCKDVDLIEYEILKVFYSSDKATEYIQEFMSCVERVYDEQR